MTRRSRSEERPSREASGLSPRRPSDLPTSTSVNAPSGLNGDPAPGSAEHPPLPAGELCREGDHPDVPQTPDGCSQPGVRAPASDLGALDRDDAGRGNGDPEFDANTLALGPGVRLLEASAGTGKTFALAHLVLRLVSEVGLRLSEILVVTFTEAAAAELRDRVGRRLQEGLAVLERGETFDMGAPAASTGAPAPDAVLQAWADRALAEAAPQREQLRIRLLLALEELAAADITTIHGFCRRTLVREALTAGRTPELQLEDPADPGAAEVVHSYWSSQVLPLPSHLLAGLGRCGIDPTVLETLLRELDGDPALELDPLPAGWSVATNLAEALPALWQQRWERFLALWAAGGRALQQGLCDEARRWREQGVKDTDPYVVAPRKDRCAELDAWIALQPEGGDYRAALQDKQLKEYFHPGSFSRVARQAEQHPTLEVRLPDPELMGAVADLLDGPAEAMLLHALHHCRGQLQRRRDRRGVSSFSQLLADLDPGPDPESPSALMEAVADRYRAALIDEFQDTDPVQWRILRRAFGGGRHLLVMVGDPKQAIYRFRGGDLGTYLAAADQADERHALTQNRRSTAALIEALNRLMAPGLRRSQLAVPQVHSHATRRGPDGAPIELLWLGEAPARASEPQGGDGKGKHPSRSELERRQPELMARHLRDLLDHGLMLEEGERRRPLVAEDVCLLVSNHRQAEQLRAAFERHGIASRLVSQADVFASPAATCLQRFLDALADPADNNRLRLLVASPLLGWSAARIASCPPEAWAELAGRLAAMAEHLSSRGLLAALSELMAAEGLARLSLGGRLAADLQQVSELVQRRLHVEQLSAASAADWLRRLRLAPDPQVPEAHQAHSDRADGTVSVITIHRSKGLEFPVVICPFLWQSVGTPRQPRIARRWQPPGGGGPVLDLHRNLHWGKGFAAERQRLLAEESERERLAYVALTRAQHRLVLAWGPAANEQCGPLLPWLFAGEPLATSEEDWLALAPASVWRERLEAEIVRRDLPIAVIEAAELPAGERSVRRHQARDESLHIGPVPRRSLDRRWGRSSYSGWIHGAAAASDLAPTAAALEEGRDIGDATPAELLDPLATPPEREVAPSPLGTGFPLPQAEQDGAAVDGLALSPPADRSGLQGVSGDGERAAEASDRPDWGPLAAFPCGPVAGDCLHRILEQLDYSRSWDSAATGAADAPSESEVVGAELRRAGLDPSWLPTVLEGLDRVRTTPFGGPLGSLRLADLAPKRWLNELRFDLSLGFAEAGSLAACFRDCPGGAFGAAYAERVARLSIASRGFLTGAIDLIIPVAGEDGEERWWVLDWKSNWLGQRDGDGRPIACGPLHYDRAAMVQLMAASHYPLQAHLYLVALHRYLRWRLPTYDPERHLGGYAYVFLRGVPGPATVLRRPEAEVPGMMVEQPPLERLLALDAALGCTVAPGWEEEG